MVERQVNELDLVGCNEETHWDDVMDMVWGFRVALSDNGQMYERKVFVLNYKLYLLSSGYRYGHDDRVVEYHVFGLCLL